jgi:site-specific DNA recombinase
MAAPHATPLRLDALIRVSQRGDRAGESIRSPVQQRDECRRWADANGAEVVAWHESIGVSGKTMLRDDVDAALERIHAGLTDGVIVAWLDRFSRAPVDEALRVYRDFQTAGGQVVAADMAGLNADDPTGEMAITIQLAIGRQQWRKLAERWDMSRRDAVKDGKAIGGAPFGYRYRDPTPRGKGTGVTDSRLVVHEREAAIVRELFDRRAGGATWLELARWLDSVAPKPNGGHWSRTTVRGMIGNRTYLGEVRHGQHVRTGAHERIVTPAAFRRAQSEPGRRTPRGRYLLSGLARCAGCGRRLRGAVMSRERRLRLYRCEEPGCPSRSTVTADRLDGEVVRQLFAHLDEFHVRAVADGELDDALADVDRLTEAVESLAAILPSHPAAIASHQRALEDAERELADAEDRAHRLAASEAEGGPDVRELRADWPTLTLEDRREILRAGIDAVLVRRAASRTARPPVTDRILVLFRGEAPDGLADNGRSGPVRSWSWDDEPGSLIATT